MAVGSMNVSDVVEDLRRRLEEKNEQWMETASGVMLTTDILWELEKIDQDLRVIEYRVQPQLQYRTFRPPTWVHIHIEGRRDV